MISPALIQAINCRPLPRLKAVPYRLAAPPTEASIFFADWLKLKAVLISREKVRGPIGSSGL